MCWNGTASTVMALVGFGFAGYSIYKNQPMAYWVSLGYFSLMELLQAYSYTVINQCHLPANQVVTVIAYLHIAFQPFFINALSMCFIPDKIRQNIQFYVYTLCFVSTIFMLLKLYPFSWSECNVSRPMCERILCSTKGTWHLSWLIPLNGIESNLIKEYLPEWVSNFSFIDYLSIAFILPVLYGSWRFTLYQVIIAHSITIFLTTDKNEWPAIWCLLSISILLIVISTRLRNYMCVKSWIFWPKLKDNKISNI